TNETAQLRDELAQLNESVQSFQEEKRQALKMFTIVAAFFATAYSVYKVAKYFKKSQREEEMHTELVHSLKLVNHPTASVESHFLDTPPTQ
nr:3A [mischivirus C1]